jgi:hypothetical protein
MSLLHYLKRKSVCLYITFEFLISRIDESLEKGFYVEGMAITYALFEERTYRLLKRLNVDYRDRDKLHECLVKLERAINDKTIGTKTPDSMSRDDFIEILDKALISSNLVLNIQEWRKKRNDVIHDLAKTNIDYSSLKATCEDGRELFGKYTGIGTVLL